MTQKDLENSTLGLVLRISKTFGIAPVNFVKNNIQISRRLQISSNILLTLMNCTLLVAVVFDFTVESQRSIRMPSRSSCLVWLADLLIVILINAVGVYAAPSRVKCIIHVLDQLKKIRRKINSTNSDISEKNLRITIILLILADVVLMFSDIYTYVIDVVTNDKEVKILIMYMFFYYQYFCFIIFECQFIVLASEVQSVLKEINTGLKNIHLQIQPTLHKQAPMTNNYFSTPISTVHNINNFIDELTVSSTLPGLPYTKKLDRVAHDLAVAYGSTCDLVWEVNNGFGLLLLLILMSFFLELVVTPYYFITALSNTSYEDLFSPLLQVLWCLYHIVTMWYVVEPSYLTNIELEKIEGLVSRLLRQVNIYDNLYTELNMFTAQLILNRPTYSPLGVCILSRNLCVTILGAVTTYLVIIIQFHAHEI